MNDKKIVFISGITGQTASFLAELLLKKEDYFVVGLKRRSSNLNSERVDHLYGQKNFIMRYFDLNDPTSIYSLLKEYQPYAFINFAAMSHVGVSFEIAQDTVNNVGMGVLRILDAIKLVSPHTKFITLSSSEMFGRNKKMPLSETSEMIPASPYGAAKLFGYHITRIYRESYNMWACSTIMFNNTSPRRGLTFVTRKITHGVASIKLGLEDYITLGNILSKRDWIYSGDSAKAIYMMMESENPKDYVISSNQNHTIEEFAKLAFKFAGIDNYQDYIKIDKKYFRPLEVDELLGDSSLIRKELGWKPEVKFEDLVKMMYESDLKELKIKIEQGKRKWDI